MKKLFGILVLSGLFFLLSSCKDGKDTQMTQYQDDSTNNRISIGNMQFSYSVASSGVDSLKEGLTINDANSRSESFFVPKSKLTPNNWRFLTL